MLPCLPKAVSTEAYWKMVLPYSQHYRGNILIHTWYKRMTTEKIGNISRLMRHQNVQETYKISYSAKKIHT